MTAQKRFAMSAVAAASDLLPGLPDHLAMLCLARVPCPASCLPLVCSSWRHLLCYCPSFHALRSSLGFPPSLWLYTLLRNPSTNCFSWHAFDPSSISWHPLPPLPYPLDLHLSSPSLIGFHHSVQCTSSPTKLIMVAASKRAHHQFDRLEPALDCPLIFDTLSRQWSQGAPFPVPRKWCACGTSAHKLFVASGCGKDWDVGLSKSVEMYDPHEKQWVSLDSLKSSKFSGEAISAVNYGGNLHMVSGRGVFWKVGAIYNPKKGAWTDMPRGMMNGWIGSCVVVDDRLLVLDEAIGRLKEYDPLQDCWLTVMQDHKLKNMEQLVGAAGKICGIVRAAQGSKVSDLIRVVDVRSKRIITDLLPPFGQIVSLQVLSSMTHSNEFR